MKYFIARILLFILILLSLSCKTDDLRTNQFESYLKNTHQETLKNGMYVLMPLNLCNSCVEKMTNIVTKNAKFNNTTIIIIDYTSVTFEEIKRKLLNYIILEDSTMKIVKAGIITGNNIVVFSIKNKEIVNIIKFEPGINDDEIIKLLKFN